MKVSWTTLSDFGGIAPQPTSIATPSAASTFTMVPPLEFIRRSGRAELLAQPRHHLGLAAHPQERPLAVGALLEHRAGVEDLPAQLLLRPGEEKLGLDQALLEERFDRLAKLRHVFGLARAHDDASGVLRAQCRLYFIPGAVDLVEDQ